MGLFSRFKFEWRYWHGDTPWDTNITPPEVMEFLATATPGRALDLGCGTGTNAVTLARHGWQATGVDFSPKAIREARRKAQQAGLKIDFYCADVADLGMLSGPFDIKPDDMRLLADTELFLLHHWQGRTFSDGIIRASGNHALKKAVLEI